MPLVGRTSTSSSQRGHPRSVGPVPSKRETERERELALTSPYNLAQSIQACKIQPSFTKSVLICINYVYLVLHYHISSWIVFANQAITTSTCQGLLPLREFVTKFCFGTRLAIHLHQSIKRLLVSGPWLETLVKKSWKRREKWSSLTTEKQVHEMI